MCVYCILRELARMQGAQGAEGDSESVMCGGI